VCRVGDRFHVVRFLSAFPRAGRHFWQRVGLYYKRRPVVKRFVFSLRGWSVRPALHVTEALGFGVQKRIVLLWCKNTSGNQQVVHQPARRLFPAIACVMMRRAFFHFVTPFSSQFA
jgi:hypothetical protein